MGTPARATQLPDRIGAYDIVGIIGRGSMSVVYDARAPDGRKLALKVFSVASAADPDGQLAARFLREGEILTRLDLKGVVKLFEAGHDGNSLYLALERVKGASLLALRRQKPFELEALVELGVRLAHTLSKLHQAGVVHRDVKPANVLLDENGYPVLADFGISGLEGATGITQTGELLGSPGFIAPEVLEGGVASPFSDQFALGRLLFELGARGRGSPLPRGPILEVVRAAQHVDWERFPTGADWPHMADVIRRMLAYQIQDRFPDCVEVQAALTSLVPDVLSSDTLAEQVAESGLGAADPWAAVTASSDRQEPASGEADVTTVGPAPPGFDPAEATPAPAALSLPIPGQAVAYAAPVADTSSGLPEQTSPGQPEPPERAALPEFRLPSLDPRAFAEPLARPLTHNTNTQQLTRRVRELEKVLARQKSRWWLWALVAVAVLAVGLIVGSLASPRSGGELFLLMAPVNEASAPSADYQGTSAPSARDLQDARGALQTAKGHLRNKDLRAAERHLSLCIELADLPACHKTLAAVYAISSDPKARIHLEQYLILKPRAPEAPAVRRALGR